MRDGKISPVRTLYNTIRTQALWLVHSDSKSGDIINSLNYFNLKIRQMNDSDFLAYSGKNSAYEDARTIQKNDEKVDLGACVTTYDTSIRYSPKCLFEDHRSYQSCTSAKANDPIIFWYLENDDKHQVGLFSKEPGRTDVCRAVFYRLNADGSIGDKLDETTREVF